MVKPALKPTASSKSSSSLPSALLHKYRYRRLMIRAGTSIALTAVMPLIIMTVINYSQYQQAFQQEAVRPVAHLISNSKRALEFNLGERISALSLVIREKTWDELIDIENLRKLLVDMKHSFGGFIDLGLIDSNGKQVSYAGPYNLLAKDYQEQDWFHEVNLRGVYISNVFMGHRNFPHFIIAVRHDMGEKSYVLRATIDTEMINRQIQGSEPLHASDTFLIDKNGVLQTPSRFYGKVLEVYRFPVPPFSPQAEVYTTQGENQESLIIGYAYIDRSPFIAMLINRVDHMQTGWISLRRDLVIFLAISITLVLGVVALGTRYMVKSIREVDIRRATVFHKMEYTNKLAAIGRLGAGVAHEINNPLAIISEKSGLLKDLLLFSEQPPAKEKMINLIDSVLKSVDRCSTITHRLLGFAKHMDIKNEKLNLETLIKDVLSFLEKEATYRRIQVTFDVAEELPHIHSDRGQLQQVFLNIINNAFAAVEEGGKIHIAIGETSDGQIAVNIADNGIGISKNDLEMIFEPFFTTKKGVGTGLGLSITYGIVEKLGGQITVNSRVGEGTVFTVTLPAESAYV